MLCAAQVLVQIGAFFWPALLPEMIARWRLTNSEAGWITAAFYGAYMLAVPVLVTLTDRIDAKRVYLGGVAAMILGHALFAALADGFWSAFIARALTGIGWAGTYMTGLKLLADKVDAKTLSRAAAAHAASIGVSGALSYVCADLLANAGGWRFAFAAASASAVVAWLIVVLAVPRHEHKAEAAPAGTGLFDFRPVLRNRSAMAYAIAYGLHTLEMAALRGWGVAFLAYVAASTGTASTRDFTDRDANGAWRCLGRSRASRAMKPRSTLDGARSLPQPLAALSRSRCCSRCSACSHIRWRWRSCSPTAR